MPDFERVRLRQLPAGRVRDGFQCGLHGRLLELEIAGGDTAGLEAGSLVEVDSERVLYLGEVYSRDGTRVVLSVDHAVDRGALRAIQEAWSGVGRQ